jgi:adenylyltransferase/sulfurtransferase
MEGNGMSSQKQFLSSRGIKEEKILTKKIGIVGLGGIGSHLAEQLSRMGFCNLYLFDYDTVEESNLVRQNFTKSDLGRKKGEAIKERILLIQPDSKVIWYDEFLNEGNVSHLKDMELILDATDNLETRYLINRYSYKNNIPWIYSAAIDSYVSSAAFIPGKTPCFECVYGSLSEDNEESCSLDGVLITTLLEAVSKQINLAICLLSGKEIKTEINQINTWEQRTSTLDFSSMQDEDCSACNKKEVVELPVLRITCRGQGKDIGLEKTDELENTISSTFKLKRKNELFSEYENDGKRIVIYHNKKVTFHHIEKEEILSYFM